MVGDVLLKCETYTHRGSSEVYSESDIASVLFFDGLKLRDEEALGVADSKLDVVTLTLSLGDSDVDTVGVGESDIEGIFA